MLETILFGPVVSVDASGLVMEHGGFRVPVRPLLPAAIGLDALLGHRVSLTISERLDGQRCTLDARIRDERGALLLWARDGELPEDRNAHGLALRLRVECEDRGLAIAHRGGLVLARGPGPAEVECDEGSLLVVVLRVASDDAAFVALAR